MTVSDVWLELLQQNMRGKVERPLGEDEETLKAFRVPTMGAMETAVDWLVRNGADGDFARLALSLAMQEAIDRDQEWLAALHKVVNRRVRENAVGWAGYWGDWLDMIKAIEAAESGEEEHSAIHI